MSFSMMEVYRIQQTGGAVAAKHARLVRAADQALHDSPAQAELGAFRQSWLADPVATAQAAEQELG